MSEAAKAGSFGRGRQQLGSGQWSQGGAESCHLSKSTKSSPAQSSQVTSRQRCAHRVALGVHKRWAFTALS